jgi:hypothetical protein
MAKKGEPKDVAFVGIVLLLFIGWLVGIQQAPVSSLKPQVFPGDEIQPATQVLNTITLEGEDGKTVYDLLSVKHRVESRASDLGIYIESIDGIGGDPDAFWLYYLDGLPATQAADKQETKTGQKIEWRYEKF